MKPCPCWRWWPCSYFAHSFAAVSGHVPPHVCPRDCATPAVLQDVLNGGQQELQFGQGAVTDVRDVARAHVLAAETPAAQGRYIVSSAFAFTPKQALAVLHKALPQYEINSPAPEQPARQLFDNSKVG